MSLVQLSCPHRAQALQMEDILREIFSHLCPRADRQTLGQLTRVCFSFWKPAMDELWAVLDGIEPLLNILAFGMGAEGNNGGPMREIFDPRWPPSNSDWVRFQDRARRVRMLCISEACSDTLDGVFHRMAMHICREPIFPKLVSLTLPLASPSRMEAMMLVFFGPQLHKLAITPGDQMNPEDIIQSTSGNVFGENVDRILDRSPNLVDLTLKQVSFMVPAELTLFQKLRKLHIIGSPFPVSALHQYARMPRLEDLRAELAVMDAQGEDSLLRTLVPGFEALRTLQLTGAASDVAKLLRLVSSTHLTSAHFTIANIHGKNDNEGWSHNRVLCEVLSSQFASSLRKVGLVSYKTDSEVRHLMDTVAPLLKVKALEQLRLYSHDALCLSDDEVRDMATSWPGMVELALCYFSAPVFPSVYSAGHFARHCLALKSLRLPCLPVPLPPANVQHDACLESASSTTLRSINLEFCRSTTRFRVRTSESRAIARFILRTFPNANVEYDGQKFNKTYSWAVISRMVNELRRKQAFALRPPRGPLLIELPHDSLPPAVPSQSLLLFVFFCTVVSICAMIVVMSWTETHNNDVEAMLMWQQSRASGVFVV